VANKSPILKCELFFYIFHPILMQILQDYHLVGYWWTIKYLVFYFEKETNSGRNFEYLESLFNTWNSKTIQLVQQITESNTLLCPVIYCVKQNTVSTHALIYTCPTFPCRHPGCNILHSA
jgi:hypothetical protein